jgi:hypothetical protein
MLKTVHNWFKREDGFSSAVIFIVSIPVILGAFGLAFDSVRLVYIKGYIQSQADLSAQAAVSMVSTDINDGKVHLDANALSSAQNLYARNTAAKRTTSTGSSGFLTSNDSGFGIPTLTAVGQPLASDKMCPGMSHALYGVKVSVSERVPATFLKLLGFQQFTLSDISSTAYVRARNC